MIVGKSENKRLSRRNKNMPFTESIKLEVKKKAMFRCCRCQNIGIDIHHIVPENDGGSSEIENAAPLCPNCHDQFGDNPQKRKELTQMRDNWYEKVEQQYPLNNPVSIQVLDSINTKLENIHNDQKEIGKLKQILMEVAQLRIDSITSGSASVVASNIVDFASGTKLSEDVYSNFKCHKCGQQLGLLIGTNKCPECGAEILPNQR